MTDSGLVLVLDIGTSSVRAALYDEKARRLDETFVKNERQLRATEDGGAEINAEEALRQVADAIAEVLKKAGDKAARIESVAASCFWHSLVAIDQSGAAITPVYGWADTRSKQFVAELQKNLDERAAHNRTGARFHPSYWTAKLLWIRETQPEIFSKAARWLSFADFLTLKFCGEAVTSVSQASGTGIFNIRKCEWDAPTIDFLTVKHEQLPRVAADKEFLTIVSSKFPALAKARWVLALGDGAANNVGAGCVTKDCAALMIGTSGAMRVLYGGEAPPEIPNGLWCYRLDRERIVIGGALSDGGGLYHWLKEVLKLKGTDDQIEQRIAESEPDAHGLTFLPFIAGERSTNWNAQATGAILGLHSATSAEDITQAALESVAFRFAAIFDELNKNCSIEKIVASGGALRESPVWTQIICDALNKKMFLPKEQEASSRGAALFALEKMGKIKSVGDFSIERGQSFTPDTRKFQIYKKARQRQEKFYDCINANNRTKY
jgi:gluconokinase